MRKITQIIANAFICGNKLSCGNTMTDGKAIFLHGNKIAERREDGSIWATLAGWNTNTTRERLNGLPGAHFGQKNFIPTFFGAQITDTQWVKIS